LQRLAEVDHDITATQQIDAGERWIAEDVLGGKNAEITNGFADLIVLINFVEKAAQAYRRDVGFNCLVVNTEAGTLNGRFAQIGAKDLDGKFSTLLIQKLQQGDGVGVGFFAAGAARHPDTNRGAPSPCRLSNSG